ncbi:hypothetical protein, partial [Paenibacillus marchantiophytorum]|uniref:hypothetical protein n=1 Tax=Paenibacillus marchantiophytorum TaxID=1619310 RepID=UPI001E5CEFCB
MSDNLLGPRSGFNWGRASYVSAANLLRRAAGGAVRLTVRWFFNLTETVSIQACSLTLNFILICSASHWRGSSAGRKVVFQPYSDGFHSGVLLNAEYHAYPLRRAAGGAVRLAVRRFFNLTAMGSIQACSLTLNFILICSASHWRGSSAGRKVVFQPYGDGFHSG